MVRQPTPHVVGSAILVVSPISPIQVAGFQRFQPVDVQPEIACYKRQDAAV